ncbi:hypothetical protein DPMN_041021 [Dreissena polymorpha]|uniref:Uncharacterized protein n=1 Tax=Dreissena polymorpha TaxID=45954 RepID=A0A9D4CWF8_DREPO|nr:hypothetical protein DPMN_041021 [Dreissena polymorpha]
MPAKDAVHDLPCSNLHHEPNVESISNVLPLQNKSCSEVRRAVSNNWLKDISRYLPIKESNRHTVLAHCFFGCYSFMNTEDECSYIF